MSTRLMDGSFEIHPSLGMSSIDPQARSLHGVGLVTLDIENVLAAYGGWNAFPGVKDIKSRFTDNGINLCLATNATESERIGNIGAELELPFVHKAMSTPQHPEGLASKSYPGIYQAAIKLVGFGEAGCKAAHVDDQLKNIKGAIELEEFTHYFWTVPKGIKSHIGVLAFRPIEAVAGGILVGAQKSMKLGRGIRIIANGQYGEF